MSDPLRFRVFWNSYEEYGETGRILICHEDVASAAQAQVLQLELLHCTDAVIEFREIWDRETSPQAPTSTEDAAAGAVDRHCARPPLTRVTPYP